MQNEGDLVVIEYGMLKDLVEGLGAPTAETFRQKIANADLAIKILSQLGEQVHSVVKSRRDRALTAAMRS